MLLCLNALKLPGLKLSHARTHTHFSDTGHACFALHLQTSDCPVISLIRLAYTHNLNAVCESLSSSLQKYKHSCCRPLKMLQQRCSRLLSCSRQSLQPLTYQTPVQIQPAWSSTMMHRCCCACLPHTLTIPLLCTFMYDSVAAVGNQRAHIRGF